MAGYTRDQIYDAMRQADKAGDAPAVKLLAAQLESMAPTDTAPEAVVDASGLHEVGPPQSLGDILGQAGGYVGGKLARGAMSLSDLMATGGEKVTNAISGGLAGAGDAVLRAGGFNGAAQSLTDFIGADRHVPTFGERMDKVIPQDSGSGAGLAAEFLGGALVPFGPKASPKPISIPAAAPTVGASAARETIAAGAQNGVRVMTSDVKPPQTFMSKMVQSMGEKIPLVGTGGTRAAQQAERVQSVKNLVREFGGEDAASMFDDTPGALEDVAKSLTEQRSKELKGLTAAKNSVINGIEGAVPTPRAIQAIDDQIAHLKGINDEAFEPIIAKLESFKRQISSGKNLSQIEGNRKLLGDLFADGNLATIKGEGQKALNAIYGPLREDMGAFIETAGGKGARVRWEKANERLAAMAGELKNAKLRNVLQTGEMTPENVGKLLFSQNRSDVMRLYANLDDFGKGRAQAAILQRAFDKAISAESGLSVERFLANLKTVGDSIGVTFQGADRARIEGLTRLLDTTRRAATASAAPPTGVQNVPAVAGYTLGALFGQLAIPVAGAAGLLARAYESAPVRNALLRLGKTPKGTSQEVIAYNRAVSALNAAMADYAPALNDNIPASSAARQNDEQGQQQENLPQP